jgi:DNA-directed RNA polymerase specialized sigma subunit
MSNKENKENKVAEKKVDKTPTTEEVIQTLKVQLQEYQTMAVKCQGALEVLGQLYPNESKGEES